MTGPTAQDVIEILTKYSTLKDKALMARIVPTPMDPDGAFNMKSAQMDLDFYKSQGMVKDNIDLAQVVDCSFVDAAIKELGPCKPK
ncbi:MAG: hypothetical protein AB7F96_09285 [Beijerinckiaceae bacterium]